MRFPLSLTAALAAATLGAAAPARAASIAFRQNAPGNYDHGRQLALPAGFGDGEFTLELWIKPDHTLPVGPTTPGTPAQLVNWSDESSAPYSSSDWWYPGNFLLDGHNNAAFSAGTFSLQFYGGGRLRWLFGDGANPGPGGVWSVGAYPEAPEPPLLDGGWHQVTLVRRWSGASSARLEMWIDGRLVDFETSPARTDMRGYWDAWVGFPGGQEGWFWGAEKQAAINLLSQYEDYKGLLDRVAFWSRAKTAAEIGSGWLAPAAPGALGLVGLYLFDEGAGGAACDLMSPAQCVALVHMQPGYWSGEDPPAGAGTALRFFGNGAFEENQVKVRIDAPAVPADVGAGDFTLEFWMKALPGQNPSGPCAGGGSSWIDGDIVFDRDVFGNGDYGDYGVSVADGRIAWGVGGAHGAGYLENTICGTRVVTDGLWHHVAVTRGAGAGLLRIFVDGQLDAQGAGPGGDASYRDGRATSYPASDPYLVVGAEKHFGASGWNGFSGWVEEVRLSDVVRYTSSFTRPSTPFVTDASTRALYHFDEGTGDTIGDVSGAAGGPSPGVRHVGGAPAGPVWVASDAPIGGAAQTVALSFAQAGSGAGEAGAATAAVTLTTSNGGATAGAATVAYATVSGTAAAGFDFVPASGTLTFPAGTASGSSAAVGAAVVNDALDEDDETFTIVLSSPSGAVLGATPVHTATILDDDPLPSLRAGDCATAEGDAGSAPCALTVALSPASGRTVSVSYATAGGSATSGVDFQPAAGVLTFPAGELSRTVDVAVAGDLVPEPDEAFSLQLQAPLFALLGDAEGAGTILDDDATALPGLELAHGADVRADLAGGTPDLYRISQPPFSSFEVTVDAAGGDAGLVLERLGSDGATVVQTAVPVGASTARSLRFTNTLAAPVTTQYVRVRATGCAGGCGPDDAYRIRAFETTGRVARFNNTGGQATVLLLQNATAQPVAGHAHFWSGAGALLSSHPFALDARALLDFRTFLVPALQGRSGSITVTHDAPHGGLAGKVGLVDGASGFAFDAPLTLRPR